MFPSEVSERGRHLHTVVGGPSWTALVHALAKLLRQVFKVCFSHGLKDVHSGPQGHPRRKKTGNDVEKNSHERGCNLWQGVSSCVFYCYCFCFYRPHHCMNKTFKEKYHNDQDPMEEHDPASVDMKVW